MTIADRVTQWPYAVTQITRDELEWAIDDQNWQTFRRSLKGLPTDVKLAKLLNRYETIMRVATSHGYKLPFTHGFLVGTDIYRVCRKCQVQVDNYLNALRRGGQLDQNAKVRG